MGAASISPPDTSSIANDLEAGEQLIPLTHLPRQSFVPRGADGKARHVSYAFRCRDRGLETLRTPSGYATTRSAWLRFLRQLSVARTSPTTATPSKILREHEMAERELKSSGF
jgi:hypothetical protein